MAEPISEKLNRAWYEKGSWVYLLMPLSFIYWLVITSRKFFLSRPEPTSIPVIVVGNITVGGTGKSPLVSYFVEGFCAKGYEVGVVSRGYGGSIAKTQVLLVQSDSSPSQVGDEPLMLKQLLDCKVAVSPTRSLAVQALEREGCDLIISDDGLQHYAMYRDLEICVIDGKRGLGNQWVLPTGPLREPVGRLKHIDYLVFNGALEVGSKHLDDGFRTVMHLVPTELRCLSTDEVVSIEDFKQRFSGTAMTAIAAIGNPQRFFSTLEQLGIQLDQTIPYPDHHSFAIQDFSDPEAFLLMTEKDAVKCKALGLKNAWYLRVRPELQDNLIETIYNRLTDQKRLAIKH